MAYKIVLFEYQIHSQFASALLGTGGRTKMDEFAQKAICNIDFGIEKVPYL